jgi:spermidine synthase
MNDIKRTPYSAATGKFYPLVLCFFVGSGLAALIYEIVWFQLLEFVIGSTAVSLAVLLGTFMGGMCLGSLAFARIIPASFHPLRVYAALEFGIGLLAIVILHLLPPAADLYASFWTRLLSLLLGASVYTFSIILAVFLLGLGLGSSAGSLLARSGRNSLVMLGWCQFFLVAAIAWAAFSIDAWLPYWPVDPRFSTNPWLTFQLDLARCLWAVLPAACLWGASPTSAMKKSSTRLRLMF